MYGFRVESSYIEYAEKYNICYRLNGGSYKSGESNPAEFTKDTPAITLVNPEKRYSTFLGWYESADFNGAPVKTIDTSSGRDYTLYARWEEKLCVLNFSVIGGGTVTDLTAGTEIETGDYKVSAGANLSLKLAANEGYMIYGLKVNGTDVLLKDGSYTINSINGDYEVEAKFNARETLRGDFSVNYRESGKHQNDWKTGLYDYDNLYITDDSYHALGNDKGIGYVTYKFVPKDDDLTFSSARFTFVAKLNDYLGMLTNERVDIYGSSDGINYELIYKSPLNRLSNNVVTTSLNLSEYVFGTKEFYLKTEVGSNSANWTLLYEMSVEFSYQTVEVIVDYGDYSEATYTQYKGKPFDSSVISPASGYKLVSDKIYTNPERTSELDLTAPVTGDIKVYVKAEKEEYKNAVRYELGGGVNSPLNPDYYDTDKGSPLYAAEREGYIFVGWFADAACTLRVIEISAGREGEITLYAKWIKNEVPELPIEWKITYELNGGENEASNPVSYRTGTAAKLKAATREGYTFLGWYKNAEFTEKVDNIEADFKGDITLYAKWSKNGAPEEPDKPDKPDKPDEPENPDDPVTPEKPQSCGCSSGVETATPLLLLAAAAFKPAPRVNAEQLTGRWLKSSSVNTSVNAKEGEFSIVVMGDQQIVLCNYSKYLAYSYDYIAKNKDAMNLKMFLNVGDIFDVVDFTDIIGGYNANDPYGRNRGTDPDTKYWFQQKEFVSEQVAKLEKANVPVALTMGNHDYEDMAYNYRINKTFNEAFPLSRFEKYAVGDSGVLDDTHYFGGAQYNDIEQAYYFFEGNGQKYMVLCLGLFPSDEMIEWANEVVMSNPDCKVIVNTHAYFDSNGRPYERSDYLWNKFLSKHENIFMVVCGHDWEDGNIIKQVDYGENAGMYFGKESQFTFDTAMPKISATEEGKSVSGRTVAGNSFYDDYVICSPDNGRWLKNVYDYKNVRIVSGKGLQATGEEGYITYKTEADEFSRIKGLYITPDCKLTDGGAYQIDISENGTEWKTVLFQNDVAGKTHCTFDVSRSLSGEKQLYIRLLLRGENFYMKAFEAEIKTVKTVLSDENGYFSAGFKAESATAANYNENMYARKDLILTEGDLLGSGGPGYLGGKGEIYYRFDAPENATLKTLSFSCTMRVERVPRTYSFAERKFDYNGTGEKLYSAAQTFGFKEKDSELALRILVSYDGGKSYEEQVTYNNADYAGANERFNCDIAVDGQKSVIVKLQFLGAIRTDVGFKSLELNGTYERKESFYDTDGGTLYGDSLIPVKDGFVFDGWYLGGVKIDNPEAYKGMGVTLRAQWKKIVSVIYVTGSAQNSPQNRTFIIEGETLALNDIALAGRTFAGWYDIEGKRYSSVTAGTDDIVLYAVFY